ncbi:MAG: cupin domain-containing protein [Rhodobacter sp.]|nr:cupin domain-containing protein [Rhodobacter sp.]
MEILRAGSRPSRIGPEESFTGRVRIDPVIMAPDPSRVRALNVTFEPGARTAWHTHPLGQILIVTEGKGLVQKAGGQIQEVLPGDVVWFAPDERHWHGAGPGTGMTHLAIQETRDGSNVTWMEHVTDIEYSGGPS